MLGDMSGQKISGGGIYLVWCHGFAIACVFLVFFPALSKILGNLEQKIIL